MSCDLQMYCSICGGPILISNPKEDSKKWLDDAIILTTAHKTEHGLELDEYFPPPFSIEFRTYPFDLGPDPPDASQRSMLRLPARSEDVNNSFLLLDSGDRVLASQMDFYPLKPSPPAHGVPLYLVAHRLCLQLADRFIDSTNSSLALVGAPNDSITSTMNLWEVLCRRLHGDSHGVPATVLPEPHNYFGGMYTHGLTWDSRDDPEHSVIFEQNPIDIPDLTSSLLQNLESVPNPTPISVHSTNFAPQPNRNDDDQSWYLSALLNGNLTPWLFDLDVTQILQKHTSSDWRGLMRRLMVPSIHDPGDISLDLPLGLKNRRRIWRLLEEARVHDVAGRWEAEQQVRKEEKERAYAQKESLCKLLNGGKMPDLAKMFPLPFVQPPVPPSGEKDG